MKCPVIFPLPSSHRYTRAQLSLSHLGSTDDLPVHRSEALTSSLYLTQGIQTHCVLAESDMIRGNIKTPCVQSSVWSPPHTFRLEVSASKCFLDTQGLPCAELLSSPVSFRAVDWMIATKDTYWEPSMLISQVKFTLFPLIWVSNEKSLTRESQA